MQAHKMCFLNILTAMKHSVVFPYITLCLAVMGKLHAALGEKHTCLAARQNVQHHRLASNTYAKQRA